MKQKELLGLLQEAAHPDCSWERRSKIHCMLGEACAAMGDDGIYEIDTPAAGLHVVINTLYVETLEKRPGMLPHLFPVFAKICGDRKEGMLCADVDWSLT